MNEKQRDQINQTLDFIRSAGERMNLVKGLKHLQEIEDSHQFALQLSMLIMGIITECRNLERIQDQLMQCFDL